VQASIYGREILGTYHERMGALPWPESTLVGNRPQGIWTRLIGWDGSYEGHEDGVLGGSPPFDNSFYALQLGADLWRNDESEDMRDRAGIYGALGHADGSVEHDFGDETVDAGDTTFDAFSLGGYFTRTGPTDWYVDAVLQFTWYNIEMTSSRGLGSVDTDALGMAASIEGGYPYPIGDDGWAVEPQAQLVYQTLDIDDFEDIAAEVKYEDTDSLAGRIGARAFREWADTGADDEPQPRSVWGRVNLWRDLTGEPTTTFSAAGGGVPFEAPVLGRARGRRRLPERQRLVGLRRRRLPGHLRRRQHRGRDRSEAQMVGPPA